MGNVAAWIEHQRLALRVTGSNSTRSYFKMGIVAEWIEQQPLELRVTGSNRTGSFLKNGQCGRVARASASGRILCMSNAENNIDVWRKLMEASASSFYI